MELIVGCISRASTNHNKPRGWEGLYDFHLLHKHLDISQDITKES